MVFAYPSNITRIADIALWTNSVTAGLFWPLILLALFVIMLISFKQYPMERALATSSFITTIIAIMMGIIGLVSFYVVVLCGVVTAIAVIVLRSSNNREY